MVRGVGPRVPRARADAGRPGLRQAAARADAARRTTCTRTASCPPTSGTSATSTRRCTRGRRSSPTASSRRRAARATSTGSSASFHKLLLNFTWWVNRKDRDGNNVFEGGFLGLDNIGVFDRSAPLPTGGYLEQADGTAWMALFCQNMLEIAVELALHDPAYAEMALKFVEHFLWIASSMMHAGDDVGMWDEEDGFFYDVLRLPDGSARAAEGALDGRAAAAVRGHGRSTASCSSKLPGDRAARCAVPRGAPGAARLHPRPDAARRATAAGWPSILDETQAAARAGADARRERVPEPVRHPLAVALPRRPPVRVPRRRRRSTASATCRPSPTRGMFGGNSNWRGPIWMPVNALIIRALLQYYAYYGDDFTVECPTGSGPADDAVRGRRGARAAGWRRSSCATTTGRRPVYGGTREVPGRPALARPHPVLRVLPRRQRRRPRREPPDRLDRRHRPRSMQLFATS